MTITRWVASKFVNSITFKKLTPMDERYPRGSFHGTWEEAHAALIRRREVELLRAERVLQSARKALVKARAMKPPVQASPVPPSNVKPLRKSQ